MIRTERLVLKPLRTEDAEALFFYRSDKIVNRYQSWIPETVSDAEEFIGKIAQKPDTPGTWYQLGLFEKQTDKLVGDVGIHFLNERSGAVELGVTLAAECQGDGYASEAMSAVIDYLIDELGKVRLYAYILKDNINSTRLFRKLGFKQIPDEDGYTVWLMEAEGRKG